LEKHFEFEKSFGYFNVKDWFKVENKNGLFRRQVLLVFRQVKDFCWWWPSKYENKKGEQQVLNQFGLFIPPSKTS